MEPPQRRMSADFRTSTDHQHQQYLNQTQVMGMQTAQRKRKADTQETNNERLSKRLSLLNLEHDGAKLYVPVEKSQQPSQNPIASSSLLKPPPPSISDPDLPAPMHLDDTKHKVYIYSLDDELSSSAPSSDDDSSCPNSPTSSSKISLMTDLSAHLRRSRIPRSVLANSDGELAGMQLVLYREPAALSVPEEYDGVRRAVVEARERIRERQRVELLGLGGVAKDMGGMLKGVGDVVMGERTADRARRGSIGVGSLPTILEIPPVESLEEDDDADAMDLD